MTSETKTSIRVFAVRKMSQRQITNEVGQSKSAAEAYLKEADQNLRWNKPERAPGLTAKHREKLREWCGKMAKKEAAYLDRVIFTDEKRFLLDYPHGSSNYWADTCAAIRVLNRQKAGCRGIIMWAGISAPGSTELVSIRDKVDSVRYC